MTSVALISLSQLSRGFAADGMTYRDIGDRRIFNDIPYWPLLCNYAARQQSLKTTSIVINSYFILNYRQNYGFRR